MFAVLATAVNLATQSIVMAAVQLWFALYIAILFGTGTGLVTKYALDKIWIFGDPRIDLASNARSFFIYSCTGVVTTAVFWTLELSFNAITSDGRFRYVGAVLGLAIGYFLKYRLDRRFVFEPAG